MSEKLRLDSADVLELATAMKSGAVQAQDRIEGLFGVRLLEIFYANNRTAIFAANSQVIARALLSDESNVSVTVKNFIAAAHNGQ